ncbi:tRNA (34-2'-O)-methyltransferase regulator RTT10 [Kluyveromyces lactis]|uniref:KLLA0E18899p n=1 Tax=Kluyveromyces lactis (strain ATCC 8585 / CBS 2359 / DSM 70799 / NBRC 1267 / NRRL Y-1140 / WM37) TaxID=284590 RepID=Q6CMN4_KLULA|nr:uncharacterized protein KLLA0_E18899g [Kluyveromyces lactis]CAG99892.1 KLLA0E18899p [Kluyveromyces lactis]|eukprot:XP_454805.1 uncharacterized protein KLLA0_E18899g [Kluyveromyces lactis]
MLQKLNHVGPSLAVKFYEKWCLCSQGPFIEVFDYSNGSSINRCHIFHRNKVHGISIDKTSGNVLVYGSRSFSIVNINDLFSKSEVLDQEKMTGEWIMSGEFSFNKEEIYLLTSYNRVLIIDPDNFTVKSTHFVEGERSILYSGSIKVLRHKVLVNAGTIMNGIIVWELDSKKKIHTLRGHEGSIFYVTTSNNGKLLASCSDDRSIIIWDMVSGKLLSRAWGHTARIWNLKFFNDDTQLISVSEDCTCRVWNYKNDELTIKDIFESHLTKNVWGVDVEETNLIAISGGNDGRLKVTELVPHNRSCNIELSLESISEQCDGFIHKANEIVKGFHWFDFGLVLITSEGNILEYLQNIEEWKFLDYDDRFFSFSITQGNENTIFFMNNKCLLTSFKFDKFGSVLQKVDYELELLTKTVNCLSVRHTAHFYLIIESPNPRDPLLMLKFNHGSCAPTERYTFSKPENMISSCAEVHNNRLLVGARFSLAFIFDLASETKPPIVVKTQAADAITSINYLETTENDALFSMTNRDGTYFFVAVDFRSSVYKTIHANKISRGFLEGSFYDSNDDFFVYGFKSNLFHIYNESQQYEVFSQPCGGAHRQWKLFGSQEQQQVLCFVKNSTLNITKIPKGKYPGALKNGTHGREIRDISFRKRSNYCKENLLFITGSEDTTVKLSSINSETGAIQNFWTLKSHVSGLQRCKFICDNFFITCSAREELFLWELNDQFSHPYVNLKQKLIPSMNNPDLRIMDFDVLFLNGDTCDFIMATVYSDSSVKVWHYFNEQNSFTLIIDGRYETCCIWNVAFIPLQNCLKLLIAPTDGHLITWDITNSVPFEIRNNELFDRGLKLETKQLQNWSEKILVHTAGIKSLDVKLDKSSDSFKVYSGGDDNAVAITKFTNNDNYTMKAEILDHDSYAASSTVTSVNLLDNDTKLLATSVDQVIRIRDITNDKLKITESKYTTVADTGSSDIVTLPNVQKTLILIGGLGLSCWRDE